MLNKVKVNLAGIYPILTIAFLLLSVVTTVFLVKTNQDIRDQAAGTAPACPSGTVSERTYGQCCDCRKAVEVRECTMSDGSKLYYSSDCVHDAPNCLEDCEGPPEQPAGCTGVSDTCCGGVRYMPDGSVGAQPWCGTDKKKYQCPSPGTGTPEAPVVIGDCGTDGDTDGTCIKDQDCSINGSDWSNCGSGNCADASCNSDCGTLSKSYEMCRGPTTGGNCLACVGSCSEQLSMINSGQNCDISCACVDSLLAQNAINADRHHHLFGICHYEYGGGCPPRQDICTNIQSDVVSSVVGYICHRLWQDGRDWWSCQETTPTPTPTPTMPTITTTTTPTPTPTRILTPTPTPTNSPTPTGTLPPTSTPTPTGTPVPTDTPPPNATNTPVPPPTNTPRPDSTPTPIPTQIIAEGPTPTRIILPEAGIDFPAKGLFLSGAIIALFGLLILL